MAMIPVIDMRSLFGEPGMSRDETDSRIADAAQLFGFFCLTGSADLIPTGHDVREQMLRVFRISDDEQRKLWRCFYAAGQSNVYRGWNPRDGEHGVSIYDLGPDVAYPDVLAAVGELDDPLLGATPFPSEETVPGWRAATARYYRAMERLGAVVMRSVARGLGLPELFFDRAFTGGISTLRLMRYEFAESGPVKFDGHDPASPRRGEHVDSGFVTLLGQHGVAGLSVKARSGEWIDVPPVEDDLVVNFGGVLERWTEGRIRATPHRVVSEGRTRFSIPFFFEPRVDAVISPLPTDWATRFEPFSYGDHLWAAMSKFPNFAGVADLRTPRGTAGGK